VEIAVLAACVLLSWLLVLLLRRSLGARDERSILFGQRAVDGVLFPLVLLCLAYVALVYPNLEQGVGGGRLEPVQLTCTEDCKSECDFGNAQVFSKLMTTESVFLSIRRKDQKPYGWVERLTIFPPGLADTHLELRRDCIRTIRYKALLDRIRPITVTRRSSTPRGQKLPAHPLAALLTAGRAVQVSPLPPGPGWRGKGEAARCGLCAGGARLPENCG
jgi:hypothetical protein